MVVDKHMVRHPKQPRLYLLIMQLLDMEISPEKCLLQKVLRQVDVTTKGEQIAVHIVHIKPVNLIQTLTGHLLPLSPYPR